MNDTDVAKQSAGAGTPRPPRNAMDRFIDGIELTAAAFVGIVAADIFISVMLRYFFSVQIPDAYDFGRLLLGISFSGASRPPPTAATTSQWTWSGPMSAA